ncbi:MAG: F0F1 ATP synthase subunit A [Acidimicrobiia bacterium]|nr:F0F1 ATP synthase subunit A [Acidimicrobiia bacterium]
MLGLEFPPISELVEWKSFGPGGLNKVGLIYVVSALLTIAFFMTAVAKGRKQRVPTGVAAIAESSVDFVRNQIIMQTMGTEGMVYLPLLATMFFFIFFSNIFEIIPGVQFPANARIAMPIVLALLVWLIFNVAGIVKQGPIQYFKGILFPPGVPKALYLLVTPIELVSTLLVRPLSLSVRLFANMLAGHLILATFAVLSAALFSASISIVVMPFSFLLLVFLMGFEILVSFLQAFIFTILAAVYIGGAVHPEH